ncbi:MAG: hypothetical protein KKA60_05760 [Proteobacteria bacterium]|nr:hypothetical protein [Pseudomonadota bacterium]
MESNRNLLVDSFPSKVIFLVILAALYVASYFVAAWLGAKTAADMPGSVPGPVPFTTLLVFGTFFGAAAGVVSGAFQKRPLRMFYGLVAGAFGSWINWVAILMFSVWMTIYGLVVLVTMTVSWKAPVWTAFSDFKGLSRALMYDHSALILWGAGMALGVVLLALYTRIRYDRINPRISARSLLLLFLVVAALGIAGTVTAPRATVAGMFKTLPQRIDLDMATRAAYGFDLGAKGQWTVLAGEYRVEVVKGLSGTDAVVKLSGADALALATGKKTLFDMVPDETYTFTGDSYLADEGLRMLIGYKPAFSGLFALILNIMIVLVIASFSVAPFLCIYETFHHDQHPHILPMDETPSII